MAIAYHITFSTYGFWLPNDPRGSCSTYVGNWRLYRYGAAKIAQTRRSVAGVPHDRALRVEAKTELRFKPVHLTGIQARAVGRGFGQAAAESGYEILACAILPEHVHMVIRPAKHTLGRVVGHLKARASWRLTKEEVHPMGHLAVKGQTPSPWAEGYWRVFLDAAEDVRRAIRYVEENPVKEGKRAQVWAFVVPFQADVDG